MKRKALVWTVVIIQVLCAAVFVFQIIGSILGLAPIGWQIFELIELGAALGLVLGAILGWLLLSRMQAQNRHVQSQLRVASGAFMELLTDRFDEWGLTPAERDVALFAIKGMSLQDIATLRNTSEGTVKAQTNAIYRKAGVAGRPQLLSLFIDELMQGELPGAQV